MSSNSRISHNIDFITVKKLTVVTVTLLSIALALALLLPTPYNFAPFGVVLMILFIITVFYYPFVGIYVYIFIYLLQPQQYFNLTIPLDMIFDPLVIVILLLNFRWLKENLKLYMIDKALLAFLVVCFISIVKAGDTSLAIEHFTLFFKTVLLYFLISRFCDTESKLKKIIWLYMGSVAFMALNATFNYYTGNFQYSMGIERAVGYAGMGPNDLANTIIIGLPFWLLMAQYYKRIFGRLMIYGFMLAMIWTIVITGSRGGMIGALFLLFLVAMFSKKRAVALIGVVFLTVVVIVIMPDQYKERFETIGDFSGKTGASQSAYGRINGLILGLEYMLENPVLGVGIGNFRWQYRNTGGDWSDAHNLIGKLAGELGMSGIITFVFFIFVYVRLIKNIRHRYRDPRVRRDFYWYISQAVILSLIMLFFQGMSSHNLFRFNWYVFASFMLASQMLIQKRFELKEAKKKAALEQLPAKGVAL